MDLEKMKKWNNIVNSLVKKKERKRFGFYSSYAVLCVSIVKDYKLNPHEPQSLYDGTQSPYGSKLHSPWHFLRMALYYWSIVP